MNEGLKSNRKSLELSLLHEISKCVINNKDVNALLQDSLEIMGKKMNLTRSTITLRSGDFLLIRASFGLNIEEQKRGLYRIGEGVTGRVAESGKSEIIPDISKSKDFLNRTFSRKVLSQTAFLCVPIINKNSVIGTFSIDRLNTQDLEADLKLLEIIANMIADAVSILYLEMEETEKLIAQNRELRKRIESELTPENAIGKSAAMLRVYELINLASQKDTHILIRGEVGSGKDFAMRAITNNKNKSLKILDCSTLQDQNIEAQLFGYEKNGILTKAILANNDKVIVYLDVMGLIGQNLQVKLAKYLNEGVYSPVGSKEEYKSTTKIIASTSGDLESRLKEGIIRQDFYYALTSFVINIPPLRERRKDIPQLAKFFLKKYCKLYNKEIDTIDSGTMNMLTSYHWPSNIRELENCIARAVIISADNFIDSKSLPPSLQTPKSTQTINFSLEKNIDFNSAVMNFEREYIVEALTANGGNAAATARQLNVSRRILNYKINKLHISTKSYKKQKNG